MADMTTYEVIESLIGDWSATNHANLYKNAFNFVADLIPSNSEMWSNNQIDSEDGNTGSFQLVKGPNTEYKILRVIIEGLDGNVRQAREVTYKEYLSGTNDNSIYYSGESVFDNVFTWDPQGKLRYLSDIGEATVYYWKYPTIDFSDGNSSEITDTLSGFPQEAHYLACIKAGLNILHFKLSEATIEDEDAELVQLLQVQIGALQQLFESEGSRLGLAAKKIGIDDK